MVAPLAASLLMLGGFVAPAHAGAASVKSAAKPATKTAQTVGTLEVCKAATNGMSGRAFQFSVNGGSAFSVTGGGCSGPMSVASGATTVVETATADTTVAAIKANHLVSKDLSARSVTVTVKAGSTPANETLVTYTNKPLAVLGLKICKAAAANSTSLVGQSFSFTENNKPPFSVAAGTVAAPNCGPVTKFKLGTVVNVAELATAGTFVSGITVSDGRGTNVNTAAGTVTATIGAGVTVVTYTNSVNPVGQLGFVEVCKTGADEYVTGSFDFTITGASGFTATRSVLVGQCTEPIQVPAGQVTVAEAARFPYATTAIDVAPAGRLVAKNLTNRTTTVTIPVGDSSTESLVTFTNATLTGQLKICKTLAPNSGALAGQSFRFSVVAAVGETLGDTIVAGPAGSTTCVIHPELLPLGSAVSITENGTNNVQNTTVTVAPASRDTGSAPPTANLTIGTGFTTATFTNQAYGTVEVCKIAADASTAIQTFHFSVNGGAAIAVKAGQCSLPIAVPAGTATVQELANPNFHLVGITATGPTGDNRLTTTVTANPATVQVPFGGVENETAVTFTNAVNTGQFKICKVSSEPTLQNVSFKFDFSVGGPEGTVSLKPGQCSALLPPIPVVGPNGLPIPIAVQEESNPQTVVSNITVANGNGVATDTSTGEASFSVNQGVTIVTYTNVRRPLGTIQICKNADDPSTASQTFQFSVNGGAAISVAANTCSSVMSVLSGSATVEELDHTNFHLESVTAEGPNFPDDRLTTASTDNPATATVPPGTGADTTTFTFTNAVDSSSLTLCKASSDDPDLSNQTFHFDVEFSFDVEPFGSEQGSEGADLKPGQCAPDGVSVPVVDPAGNPVPVVITETAVAGVSLTDVAIENGTITSKDLANGTATITVGTAGETKITFTNEIDVNPCIVNGARLARDGFVRPLCS